MTLQELQDLHDDILDDDLVKNEATRLRKLAERRAEQAAAGGGVGGANVATSAESLDQQRAAQEHQKATAMKAKNVAMLQAAGTANAAMARPARGLMAQMDASGAFAAPAIVGGKRCDAEQVAPTSRR